MVLRISQTVLTGHLALTQYMLSQSYDSMSIASMAAMAESAV